MQPLARMTLVPITLAVSLLPHHLGRGGGASGHAS